MMNLRGFGLGLSLLALFVGCKPKDQGVALVADAGTTAAVVEAGTPANVDISQCAGCQLTAQAAWTFEGIYADAACTDPIAQQTAPACAAVPTLGAVAITYVDTVGGRKAGETANVTLVEQVAAATARYRKAGTACVRANEGAVDVTPPSCAGQRVCRDTSGALACTNCRTFANGCPDLEETRLYATINDPTAKKGAATGAGGGSLAQLRQCCTALAAEAKRMGAAPEAGVLATAAAQCTALANQAGPNGNAPELSALRAMLAGRKVPAVCAGF